MPDAGPGRPPHEPTAQTRQTVELMSAAGLVQEDIARCLGVCVDTLAAHYREELDTAAAKATAKVAASLFNKAISKDHPQAAAAAMFWLKTRAKWKETSEHQHTGADGAPLAIFTGVPRDPS